MVNARNGFVCVIICMIIDDIINYVAVGVHLITEESTAAKKAASDAKCVHLFETHEPKWHC